MTPSQLLRNSAALLEDAGWVQGAFSNRGGYCVLGALRVSCNIADHALPEAWELLKQVVGTSITYWNDVEGRTKEEVTAALIKAAEIGEPEKRRVLIPNEAPVHPMSPDSPLWTDPTIPEPNPVKVPERVPA